MAKPTKQERQAQLLAEAASSGLWDFKGADGQTYEVCYTCCGAGITQGTCQLCSKCGGKGCRIQKPAPPKFDVEPQRIPTAYWNTGYKNVR